MLELLKVSSETVFLPRPTRTRITEPRKCTSAIWPARLAVAAGLAAERDRFGAERQRQRVAGLGAVELALERDLFGVDADLARRGVGDGAFEHIQRADEIGDELRRRTVVDLERRADLLGLAAIHDDDAVGDRQRLFLVVRDEDGGDAELLLDRADLLAQRNADLGVERRQRLVEQQQLRLRRQRAGERDALLLAAGELVGIAVAELRQLDDARASRRRACRLSALATPATFSPKAMFCATVRLGNSA